MSPSRKYSISHNSLPEIKQNHGRYSTKLLQLNCKMLTVNRGCLLRHRLTAKKKGREKIGKLCNSCKSKQTLLWMWETNHSSTHKHTNRNTCAQQGPADGLRPHFHTLSLSLVPQQSPTSFFLCLLLYLSLPEGHAPVHNTHTWPRTFTTLLFAFKQ